jgi:hypothetical protein
MAFIVFNQRYKGKLSQVVPANKARKIQAMLDNPPDDTTEEQGEFLLAIYKIYPGKSQRAAETPRTLDTSHLYHEGIQQGVSQQLPTGDRD